MRDTLLLTGVIGIASGILCRSFFISGGAVVGLLVVWSALALCTRTRTGVVLAVFLVCMSLGILRATFVDYTLPSRLAPYLSAPRTIEGVVIRDPDVRERSQRLTIETTLGSTTTRVLAVAPLHTSVAYGDRVRVTGARTLPKSFEGDGGRAFDYPHFLARDGIFMMVEHAQIEHIGEDTRLYVRAMRVLLTAKHMFVNGLRAALPEPGSALAEGILTGGKQGLGDALMDVFARTGLLPIVVLSGYNVMIVAEMVLVISRRLSRTLGLALAGVSVTLFVMIAGMGASAVRALLMAGLVLVARATGRTYDALRALIATFALMILVNPLTLAYDPGFQFSFAAALGLILGTDVVSRHLVRVSWASVRELMASTVAAQVMVLPLLLYHVGLLSLVSLPANLLVLPVIPLAMLCSAVAGMLGMLVPSLAPLLGLPAYGLLMYVIEVARALAAIPFAAVTLPMIPVWMVVLMYGVVGYVGSYMKRTTPQAQVPAG